MCILGPPLPPPPETPILAILHNLPPLFKTVQNYFGPTLPSSKLCKTIMVQPPLFKTVQNYFGPKGKARTHGPRAPSVQKAKLGYSDCLWSVFEFCTLSGGV